MSFSSKVKAELCRVTVERDCCKIAELAAIIHTSGTIKLAGRDRVGICITTENACIARRAFMLIKELYGINPEILVRKNKRLRKNNSYLLLIPQSVYSKRILSDIYIFYRDRDGKNNVCSGIHEDLIRRPCCKRAYLRGAFLGGGSVSDPEKGYHLEFVSHRNEYSEDLCELLNYFDLHAKIVERKNNFVVYLKEGEHIVNLFSIIGAHTALLNLENIRIYKDMRNNINRIVNCETANLGKTVNASLRQIDNIKYLKENSEYQKLPHSLKEIAELRLNYPDASLKELGQMLSPPMGKSGVNHRLRKLDQLADDLRIKKGEI
ncbi:DNA-binding protein WhiA [Xylanivirga thermophila]|jgi:cell division protein WhiA|uniref:DNA-binding protein WhiA n=1 Tax=Xylanivirga thermophila TaxID=2496273 RepID=UPI00101DC8EE|nr:DNA-binding protein WhiA [Xylanivirga thermophila]